MFLQAVASKCSVHQDVVETVLHAVETVAVETLKEQHRFHISFLQGKLIEKHKKPATEQKVFGNVVVVPAQPARKNVKFSATKDFRKLFQ